MAGAGGGGGASSESGSGKEAERQSRDCSNDNQILIGSCSRQLCCSF